MAKKDWTEEAAIAPIAEVRDTLLADAGRTFCSFTPETMDDRIKLYNAINSPEYRVADMINKPIYMVDAILVQCELVDENTGEVYPAVRSIIIDAEGKTYVATATGIRSSLANIFSVFHTLHFDEPLKVTVQQVHVKRGNTLTLTVG